MMAYKFEQLRKMSIDDLKRDYDSIAASTQVGLSFLRDEIARRESEKLTKQMRNMTAVILLLTITNVALVACNVV